MTDLRLIHDTTSSIYRFLKVPMKISQPTQSFLGAALISTISIFYRHIKKALNFEGIRFRCGLSMVRLRYFF